MSVIVRGTDTVTVWIPFLGRVILPPPDGPAWYVEVVILALIGIIEWPAAAILAVCKALAGSRVLEAFGRALEGAR
jgi:hypothetical protein